MTIVSLIVGCASDPPTSPNGSGASSPSARGDASASNGSTGGDGQTPTPPGATTDASAPGGFVPASHPAPPQVVSLGGPVIAPHIVPITYAGDPLAADIDKFTAVVGATSYWSAIASEYGVGAATTATPVHLNETPPPTIDDNKIQQWLSANIGGVLPAATPGILYAVFYPASTSVSWNGASGCDNVEGYHWDLALSSGAKVSYAVLPRCAGAIGAPGLTGLDVVTFIASHEYIEAATDPFPTLQPAFGALDPDHAIWGVQENVEVGDLCSYVDNVSIKPAGLPYAVQRTWSNASIRAGHDPCVPAPSVPYFNTVPALEDAVTISSMGQSIVTKGIKIPVGQSRTLDLALFSDVATPGPWTVSAVDAPSYGQPAQANHLSFAIDKTRGANGDPMTLTITVKSFDEQLGGAPFMLTSTIGQHTNSWFGVVGP